MTPLGRPVVPLEYGMATMSSLGLMSTFSGKALPSSSHSCEKGRHPSDSPITMISYNIVTTEISVS